MNTICRRQPNKKSRKPGKFYMTHTQRIQLAREVGDTAVLLYLYYYDKAAWDNFEITNDKMTARAMGWTERKVQDMRRKLTKAGWVFKKTWNDPTGKMHLTLLGKEMIQEFIKTQTRTSVNNEDTQISLPTIAEALGDTEGKLLLQGESIK